MFFVKQCLIFHYPFCINEKEDVLDHICVFQAEDGIRDGHVTGVQTCALPICRGTSTVTSVSGRTNSATVSSTVAGRLRSGLSTTSRGTGILTRAHSRHSSRA